MSRRVLIPLDRTERSESALEALPRLCDPGDEVILLSIDEPRKSVEVGSRPGRIIGGGWSGPGSGRAFASRPDVPVYAETSDQIFQSQLDELISYLETKDDALREQGFKVELAAEINGDPADAIVDVARRVEPTFILMVRTTRRDLGERLFGTVAQQVIREGVAPVMILP